MMARCGMFNTSYERNCFIQTHLRVNLNLDVSVVEECKSIRLIRDIWAQHLICDIWTQHASDRFITTERGLGAVHQCVLTFCTEVCLYCSTISWKGLKEIDE